MAADIPYLPRIFGMATIECSEQCYANYELAPHRMRWLRFKMAAYIDISGGIDRVDITGSSG
jgi:hypothetical protein